MKNVMRVLADDIALGLVEQLRRRKAVSVPPPPRARAMCVDEAAEELDRRQDIVQTSAISEQQVLLRRLQRVERTLEKLAARIRSGPTETGVESNSGEEGSKYQNVDTLLKYVDGSGAEGGVKLVIMNFND